MVLSYAVVKIFKCMKVNAVSGFRIVSKLKHQGRKWAKERLKVRILDYNNIENKNTGTYIPIAEPDTKCRPRSVQLCRKFDRGIENAGKRVEYAIDGIIARP
jgi:hypothetical protein